MATTGDDEMDRSEEEAVKLPSGVQLTLTVAEGPDRGRSVVIDRERLVVGRGKVDFRLTDDAVSSKHFAVRIASGEARLEDLGTTNGTRINGERTDQAVLINQDEILIGESKLIFRVRTSVKTTPPPAAAPDDGTAPQRMKALQNILGGAPPDETVRDGSADQQPKVGVVRPDTAVFLEVVGGVEKGQSFDLSQPGIYIIGRENGEIPLSDSKCSKKHAQIQVLGEDQYYLSDLASTNGTFLNEVRTGRRRLKHMDMIRIGATTMRFSCLSGTVPVAK